MTFTPINDLRNASNSNLIFYFTKCLLKFFDIHPLNTIKSQSLYSKRMLISRLIYLMKISKNENFKADPSTLKGYLSKKVPFQLGAFDPDYFISLYNKTIHN